MSQGGESNDSGTWLERLVERTFVDVGYSAKSATDDQDNSDLFQPQILIKNVPYQNLFGRQSRIEFELIDERYDLHMPMECRNQETSGSVHEKIPYFYLNALYCLPGNVVAFIYSGDWYTNNDTGKASIEWLKNAIKAGLYAPSQRKQIYVVDATNIRRFARKIAAGEL